jgi:hypothetical protein
MSFNVPTFNLSCNLFDGATPLTVPRLTVVCNLALGRRIGWYIDGAPSGSFSQGLTPALLLPALTDVRSGATGGPEDMVEVPAGSSRFYTVTCVDDVGKGFPNEYRIASISQIWSIGPWVALGVPNWPVPIP